MSVIKMAPQQSHHFSALDGLRGLAALSVVIYHLNGYGHGYLAVDFFFILSGFVIAFSYEKKLVAGSMNFISFLQRRLIRLYPLVFISMLLGSLGYYIISFYQPDKIAFQGECINTAILGFLLIPVLYQVHIGELNNLYPFNGPLWSLFFELFFNAAYALTVRYLTLRILIILFCISASALICPIIKHHGLEFGFNPKDFGWGFFRAATPLTLGVIIFRLDQNKLLPTFSCPVYVLGLALSLILVTPALGNRVDIIFGPLCSLVLFPIIVMACINVKPIGRTLKLCRLSGDLSYPLYVLHRPVVRIFMHTATTDAVTIRPWYYTSIAVILCVLSSYIALKIYDEPLRKFLSRQLIAQ